MAIFTEAMLEGRQPQIFGDGNQERDFVYADDVVEATLHAMRQGDGDTFNIGTGAMTSVNRIIMLLQSIMRYGRTQDIIPPVMGKSTGLVWIAVRQPASWAGHHRQVWKMAYAKL